MTIKRFLTAIGTCLTLTLAATRRADLPAALRTVLAAGAPGAIALVGQGDRRDTAALGTADIDTPDPMKPHRPRTRR